MAEEIMFNLEDLDIKEESLDIIDEQKEEETKETLIDDSSKEEEIIEADIKEEKEEIEGNPPSTENEDSSHSTLYTLAKHLKEEGVLYLEEDIDKVESLEDLKALILKSNEAAKYANLNESQRRYQDALASGIPKAEYEEVEKQIQTYQTITDEQIEANETLRFEILALDLIEQGLSQENAVKLAKIAVKEEDVVDVKKALGNLIDSKKTKFKTLLEETTKKKEVALEDIKNSIFSKKDLVEMPLTDIAKNKLFNLMTTKVETADDGTPLNKVQKWQRDNPIEANIFINYMYMMTNEGKDLGLIKKSTGTTAAKELEKKLKSMSFDENGSLIIPDSMLKSVKTDQGRISTNDLTINI